MLLTADSPLSGGLGFLVLAVFLAMAVVIFVAMNRSMRRMRSHVDKGDFGRADALGQQAADALGRDAGGSGSTGRTDKAGPPG